MKRNRLKHMIQKNTLMILENTLILKYLSLKSDLSMRRIVFVIPWFWLGNGGSLSACFNLNDMIKENTYILHLSLNWNIIHLDKYLVNVDSNWNVPKYRVALWYIRFSKFVPFTLCHSSTGSIMTITYQKIM